ncbi:TVP38/TMEM64 family protein [Aldersonia sp. NBC_00410]|uniref:TVP38/TMEM64 family protein n=1 Tax=Aldersonia sp. NBC_00410 TaxID=2975954 RepID=UPI0022599B6E|nr:TVP38/TMEM64 family protein [Aldersonia sp. NBC_00410]MCX5046633.1 TVP38/TMEM64 family protein [Aldersonia sp. NBC_00410]
MRTKADPKLLAGAAALAAAIVIALLVPHPNADGVEHWVRSFGPWVPLVFLLLHAVVTVAPFPRTVFTLCAGLLFGPVVGVGLAVSATTASAVLALILVRALGRDAVSARLTHPVARAVDVRLARRGWLAVGSLRLMAPVPFSVINYCCAVSSVRILPYTLATLIGVIPGTISVVVLGAALTGDAHPAMFAVSAACLVLGAAGLLIDARLAAPAPVPAANEKRTDPDSAPSSASA